MTAILMAGAQLADTCSAGVAVVDLLRAVVTSWS
jgi:hypothetical protein